MSKKIIRLTENQLEKIVRKVLAEQQDQPDFFTSEETGETYKLPQIQSLEDVNKFINIDGGGYADVMKILRNFGLKWDTSKSRPSVNPMDVNVKWNQGAAVNVANQLFSYFSDGLSAIALTGMIDKKFYNTPTFVKAYNNQVYGGKYNLNKVRSRFTNFDDVLEKVAKQNLQKLS
jgi:hypothetical protein